MAEKKQNKSRIDRIREMKVNRTMTIHEIENKIIENSKKQPSENLDVCMLQCGKPRGHKDFCKECTHNKQPRTWDDIVFLGCVDTAKYNAVMGDIVWNEDAQKLFKEIFDDAKNEIEFACRGISLNKEHEINLIFSNMKQRLAI